MLIVNNPSVHRLEIASQRLPLTIMAQQNGQRLDIEGEAAELLKARLSKAYPYLTFGEAEEAKPVQVSAQATVVEQKAAPVVDATTATEPATDAPQSSKRGR